MGTLSGGGVQRISVGARALLGANSGIGISIGDDTVVEAGLYITAGTKVVLIGSAPLPDGRPRTAKAAQLSGVPNMLFRRNSLTGAVEVLPARARAPNSTRRCTPDRPALALEGPRTGEEPAAARSLAGRDSLERYGQRPEGQWRSGEPM